MRKSLNLFLLFCLFLVSCLSESKGSSNISFATPTTYEPFPNSLRLSSSPSSSDQDEIQETILVLLDVSNSPREVCGEQAQAQHLYSSFLVALTATYTPNISLGFGEFGGHAGDLTLFLGIKPIGEFIHQDQYKIIMRMEKGLGRLGDNYEGALLRAKEELAKSGTPVRRLVLFTDGSIRGQGILEYQAQKRKENIQRAAQEFLADSEGNFLYIVLLCSEKLPDNTGDNSVFTGDDIDFWRFFLRGQDRAKVVEIRSSLGENVWETGRDWVAELSYGLLGISEDSILPDSQKKIFGICPEDQKN